MDTCDHENDYDSIVVHGKNGCGICSLFISLSEAEDEIAALKDEIKSLENARKLP